LRPSPGEHAVAVIGAGSIGTGWAVLFAAAGFTVHLQDIDSRRLAAARDEAAARLGDLAAHGLLDQPAARVAACIGTTTALEAALADAAHVQECVPEQLDLKQRLFARLDELAPAGCPIASSSSFIPASHLAESLPGRGRCLVVHPGNPPYLLRVAELVPAPFTAPETVERTEGLLQRAGVVPIRVRREVEGFVFNRLQGALLREAYCLVRDGVASVADIDLLVRDGLGLRWSAIGPFETVDLNTRGGIVAHAERMGPSYARMGAERGQNDPWTTELVAEVAAQRRNELALADWNERVAWRDRTLMALLKARVAGRT
jgi:L-gulonate 3-dehydrogenase